MDTPLGEFGTTLRTSDVAALWGVSSDAVYSMVRNGSCPVAPLRLGRLLRWPTTAVLAQLGIEVNPAA